MPEGEGALQALLGLRFGGYDGDGNPAEVRLAASGQLLMHQIRPRTPSGFLGLDCRVDKRLASQARQLCQSSQDGWGYRGSADGRVISGKQGP